VDSVDRAQSVQIVDCEGGLARARSAKNYMWAVQGN